MKFKLDENLSPEVAILLRSEFHDVMTVRKQGLAGTDDLDLLQICAAEDRVLLTCDRDFQNAARFPPRRFSGIIVLRVKQSRRNILAAVRRLLPQLVVDGIRGQTWIVGESGFRVQR